VEGPVGRRGRAHARERGAEGGGGERERERETGSRTRRVVGSRVAKRRSSAYTDSPCVNSKFEVLRMTCEGRTHESNTLKVSQRYYIIYAENLITRYSKNQDDLHMITGRSLRLCLSVCLSLLV
jgi:hypothetical protein